MNNRELLVLLTMCTIWAFHFIVIKIAVLEIPPLFYAAIRMTVVAVLLAPFLRWRKGQMIRVMTAGACLGGLNYAFMFTGLSRASASTVALAVELYVPFATILSVLFLGERVGLIRVLSISLAFAGVAIIAISGRAHEAEPSLNIGVILVIFAALFEAIGAVIIKKTDHFKPIELLAWFAVVGAITLWAATAALETNQLSILATADKGLIIGAILYSAIGGSIIAHTSFYWLLQRLPLSLVAPSGLLTTMLAVLFAVIFLNETLTPSIVLGGMMVLSGVGVVMLRSNKS